ncbi:MAG: bifunctional precorrin-2 dehydrogenase/sirohydrochlorin ferrochelatase [Lachnospiraceae bacterium]|nr:bifunctional precorrin-2 dehydrogenase/sirohydrochlorin ferrochelatase [Lachnospiraceae bacterium]
MTVFPLFENIDRKTFLIVGGGNVARRKVERLLQFTNRIVVIAEETDISGVKVIRRPFALTDLDRGDFVIAATDDRELNQQIAGYCNEHRIPVNVVDDPELCSFIFPSVVKRGDLAIGISTGGTSPAYSQLLRKTLERNLPSQIGGILERMGKLRSVVPQQVPEQERRARCYKEILSELLLSNNATSDKEIDAIIYRWHYHLEEERDG